MKHHPPTHRYSDITAIAIDNRTLRLTLKPAPAEGDSGGGVGGGGHAAGASAGAAAVTGKGSAEAGLIAGTEVVYKAVSDKTASVIYNCVKQRLDRAAALSLLEKQERLRAKNQEEWVSHLNKCCDDVFDDVVGSSFGKSIVEAEAAALVKAGQAPPNAADNNNKHGGIGGIIMASVRVQFRTAATRKLVKKFDRIYPSLSAVLSLAGSSAESEGNSPVNSSMGAR